MKFAVNPRVRQIDPYKAGRTIEEIQREYHLDRVVKLASNENCLPIPEHVRQAIRDELEAVHLYPDSDNYLVRRAIAEHNHISIDQVIAGAGSVELIRMIIETFLRRGEKVLSSEKTFSYYRIATTEVAGRAAFLEAPMDGELRFDLEAILQLADDPVKIIFLANPNNPTGTMVSASRVRDFLRRIPDDKIVVLDNAYQEFVDDPRDHVDGFPETLEKKNVIVLRTFSKVYGLAGLRIGYAVSHPDVIAVLNRVKPPFNVNRVAQRAAIASLESDEFRDRSVALNRKNKAELSGRLSEAGMRVIPSQTNFLLFSPTWTLLP